MIHRSLIYHMYFSVRGSIFLDYTLLLITIVRQNKINCAKMETDNIGAQVMRIITYKELGNRDVSAEEKAAVMLASAKLHATWLLNGFFGPFFACCKLKKLKSDTFSLLFPLLTLYKKVHDLVYFFSPFLSYKDQSRYM